VPTYQYTCTECGEPVEAVQKFSDPPLTICENCGGRLRKVFSPVGIVFKGSGFYRTDSRNGSKPAAGTESKDKDKDKSTPDSAAKPDSGKPDKPAEKKTDTTSTTTSKSSSEKVA
jgi:putative FmdB family regulatory protein